MKAVGYRGILDIGYRYDARDGAYKLLDANPRIGATFRLFVGTNGLDVARALYLDLTGQEVPPTQARQGRKWLVENKDLESWLALRREGEWPIGAWLRSLRGVQERAWFARDDPAPFLMMCVGLLSRVVRDGLRPVQALTARTPATSGNAGS
jgi:predicted ATP-grasp superfamily ATP-dependent carboligase